MLGSYGLPVLFYWLLPWFCDFLVGLYSLVVWLGLVLVGGWVLMRCV